MEIKELTITERASVGYQVSEYSYTIALEPEEDPTEAINYIRNLAINNASEDAKVLASKFPANTNNNGAMAQQPRQYNNAPKQGYNNAPKQQYRAPYQQQGNRQQPRPTTEPQRAFYRQLAEQLGYDPNACPENSQEAAKAIQAMKQQLGME